MQYQLGLIGIDNLLMLGFVTGVGNLLVLGFYWCWELPVSGLSLVLEIY